MTPFALLKNRHGIVWRRSAPGHSRHSRHRGVSGSPQERTLGQCPRLCSRASSMPRDSCPPWQRRTNVWRRTTNPARGIKRPREAEPQQDRFTPPILVSDGTSLSRRYQQGFINWRCGHILCPALLEGTHCQSRSRLRDRMPVKLFHRGKGARGFSLGSLVEY